MEPRLICISELILLFTCFVSILGLASDQSDFVCDQKKFYDKDHAIKMETFVPVPAGSDFPIQNLPYGVFTTAAQVNNKQAISQYLNPLSNSEPFHLRLISISGWLSESTF